ncbi:uncharacterized protein [Triticum aestivum]|nr:uncharacterized protein LOC123149995 [Triticum aestivum]VAI69480.1 unnamed protein product [Triticum turgidum subsp. durum]
MGQLKGTSFAPSREKRGRENRIRRRRRGAGPGSGAAGMSSSTTSGQGQGDDAPDLVCVADCVHGMVDALSCVRWNKHQGAVVELSEHGIVVTVEESGCLQAKVYLKTELFAEYDYGAEGRPRFGLSLGLLVDCLNMFTVPGFASPVEIRYPGPDMQLLLRSVGSPDACIHAEIRTRIPDTVAWDYHFEHAGNTPVTFTVKSAILKESIDDLEWPGSSIQIHFHPDPPSVIFKGEGHGDLEIEFSYYANTDLLIAFQCDQELSYRYKYKFLRATTSNVPSSALKENRGSKVTIGRGGMLKIQHLVSVARLGTQSYHNFAGGAQQPSRIAFIEFFVKPEEDD